MPLKEKALSSVVLKRTVRDITEYEENQNKLKGQSKYIFLEALQLPLAFYSTDLSSIAYT